MIEAKEQLVLKCALAEFSEHGYRNASTNRIVKAADTSKGILFHYFGSKKQLMLTVLDQSLDVFDQYLENEMKELPPELLARYLALSKAKVKMFMEFPMIYKLVSDVFREVPEELGEEIVIRQRRMQERYAATFLEDADYSAFSPEFEREKVVQLIHSVLDQLTHRFMEQFKHAPDRGLSELPNIIREFEEHTDMLKKGIYKNDSR
ncbi:TetR/AcrR family transcriptional regulator [Paenibacillus sp. IB182363]|uniref:TetR/AcrR family transcriptional regulator n=2 Tax=Paenibacillus oceani TaxID=2772510 RepID=A0A927CAF1_9BACL|nr:TetR/AcrR family transcriptional regulator [Paenibacillus oceani]